MRATSLKLFVIRNMSQLLYMPRPLPYEIKHMNDAKLQRMPRKMRVNNRGVGSLVVMEADG